MPHRQRRKPRRRSARSRIGVAAGRTERAVESTAPAADKAMNQPPMKAALVRSLRIQRRSSGKAAQTLTHGEARICEAPQTGARIKTPAIKRPARRKRVQARERYAQAGARRFRAWRSMRTAHPCGIEAARHGSGALPARPVRLILHSCNGFKFQKQPRLRNKLRKSQPFDKTNG